MTVCCGVSCVRRSADHVEHGLHVCLGQYGARVELHTKTDTLNQREWLRQHIGEAATCLRLRAVLSLRVVLLLC